MSAHRVIDETGHVVRDDCTCLVEQDHDQMGHALQAEPDPSEPESDEELDLTTSLLLLGVDAVTEVLGTFSDGYVFDGDGATDRKLRLAQTRLLASMALNLDKLTNFVIGLEVVHAEPEDREKTGG